jgi:hypothetical protein
MESGKGIEMSEEKIITFEIQGSAPEPYLTTFRLDGKNLTAHCSCQAGIIGQYCKHRLRILDGKKDGILSGNEADVQTVVSWLKGTDVEIALHNVKNAELKYESAKTELALSKKILARSLMN